MQKVYAILTGISKKPVPNWSSISMNYYRIDLFLFPSGSTSNLYRSSVPVPSQPIQITQKNKCSLFFFSEFLFTTDCIGFLTKLALSFRSMPEDNHQHISVVPPLLRQDVLLQKANQAITSMDICWMRDSLKIFWTGIKTSGYSSPLFLGPLGRRTCEKNRLHAFFLPTWRYRVSSPDGRLQSIRQHGRIRIGMRSHVFRKTHPDGTSPYWTRV